MLVGQAPEDLICTWTQALQKLIDRIGVHFQRPEPRRRVGRFVAGLLGGVERCNGWQLAEHAGEATPDGMQRLLYQAKWDPDAVCADVADYVGEHLGEPSAVLVVDESGMPKKGTRSAGVAPQYCGARNTVVNCQVGVFVAYVSRLGTALVERELYLPKAWTDDRERCRGAGIPDHVGFACKQQLAVRMLERLVGRVPAAWVAADAVYGPDTWLRAWLEGRGLGYVLGIRAVDRVTVVAGEGDLVQVAAGDLTGRLEASGWLRISAGAGVQGPRWWDWARLELPQPTVHGHTCWLLVRRHPQDPTELAFFVCAGPPGTPLAVLARVEGARWGVEEALQTAKGDTGLDHYEVRRYDAWYRHVTLSLLAAAFLAVQRAATGQERGRGGDHAGCAGGTERAGGAPAAVAAGLAACDRPGPGVGVVSLAPPASGPRPPRAPAAPPAPRSSHLTALGR
jgi:SRSO17 transposase